MSNIEGTSDFNDPNEFSNINSKLDEEMGTNNQSIIKLINILEKKDNELKSLADENNDLKKELKSFNSQLSALTIELYQLAGNEDGLSHIKGHNEIAKSHSFKKNGYTSKIFECFSNIAERYEKKLEEKDDFIRTIENENLRYKVKIIEFTKKLQRICQINKATTELVTPIKTRQQVKSQLYNLLSEVNITATSRSSLLNQSSSIETEEDGISRDMLGDDSLSDYSFECQMCSKRFLMIDSLQKHYLQCNGVIGQSQRLDYSQYNSLDTT
ncbi:DgyrCDS2090 [Dimorphilus gyrociliatus]|uniref:DgyrCDS2090 n=1 Tax=Dimorphilus gyrociliatus TaxID=2664684 RepID=A0A7I8V9F1_9ANNE|nr:DgyrCDS2090 [Dimorphilus gyrociliatus]